MLGADGRLTVPAPSHGEFCFVFLVHLSYHTTHTTKTERRAEKQCRRRGASSGQKTKRGIFVVFGRLGWLLALVPPEVWVATGSRSFTETEEKGVDTVRCVRYNT